MAVFCNYCVGLPLALLFGFTYDMGDRGFWLGMLLAQVVNDIVFFFLIYLPDWEIIGQKIRSTLEQEKHKSDDDFHSCSLES